MSMYDERIAKLKKQQNENSQSLKTSQAGSMYDERIAAIKASENPSAKANADIISLFSEKYREDQQKRTENAKRFQEERQEFKSRHGSNVDLMKFDLDAGQKEIDKLVAELARLRTEKNAKALDFSSRPYAAGQVAEDAQYTTGYGITNNRPYAAGLQAQQNIEVKDDPIRELEMQIAKKKQDFNLAKQYQKEVAYDDTVKNADFDQYDDYVESDDDQHKWINDTQFRESYEAPFQRNGVQSKYAHKNYDKMHASEIAIYNYYYAKSGKEAAQKYLDTIQERLNERTAEEMYSTVQGNTAAEIVFGVAVGTNQFITNVANNFRFKDDYIPQSAYQIAGKMADEGLADASIPLWYNIKEGKWEDKVLGRSLGQIAYDAVTTGANMAPSILVGMATGVPVLGTATMGLSAAGGAYQQALNEGYDKNQARGYSMLVGASEMTMEKLLGGISAVGGNALGRNAVKNIANADTALKAIAKRVGGSALSEFGEEYLQEVLDPVFSNIMLKTDKEVKPISAEALYSGILGMLTGAIMESPSAIYGETQTASTGRKLKEAGGVDSLAKIGNTFAADTVAYKLAGKVNENTGAYTIGKLFNEIGATLTEQNVNDISEALMKERVGEIAAKKYAQAFAYVVEGGAMPDSMVNAIEADTVLAKAAREVLIDSNTTWNQRTQGYNEVLRKLAMDKVTGKKSGKVTPATDQKSLQVDKNSLTTAEESAVTQNASDGSAETVAAPKVSKIQTIEKGKTTVKLDDGTEVDLKDAALDPEDSVRIETIANVDGMSAEDASTIYSILKTAGGKSAQMDALGAKEAYQYGYYGLPESQLTEYAAFANSLTESQRKAVYEIGQKARQKKVENTTFKKSGAPKVAGKVHFDGDRSALNERQQVSLKTMDRIAEILGVQIYVFESKVGKNGKRIGENGWYDPKDGSIHIDLYAGATGEATMLFTLAHELTHYIRQWSPQKFKVLADFLMEEYGKKGVRIESLIREQQNKAKRNGRTISYDTAYEEVVADSMEMMLSDGNVMKRLEKLKAQDKDLWSQIKRFVDNMAAKIREVYKGLKPDSKEAELVKEMGDTIYRLQELFAEGLVNASENFQTAEKNTTDDGGEQKNGSAGSDIKYSIREAFYKEFDAWNRKDTNVTFTTGTTSDALKSIGMKDQEIVLRSGTVLQKLKDHPEMTLDTFKGIPELLEHPIIVQFSDAIDPKTKRQKYESSITVLGELYAEVKDNGNTVKKPVLVSLELLPTNQKKTAVLNFAIIKSAYSKNALQQYLNENSILYIDPNKKRTDSWLSLNRLQLPLGEKRYGPIRKIAYIDGKVKVQNPKSMTEMQKRLFEAGIIDEFGNKLLSDRDSGNRDRDYMDAVKRGDMETAQRMVDEAAKEAGYTVRGYHGTTHRFFIFDTKHSHSNNDLGNGHYFTTSEEEGRYYTDIDNPDMSAKIDETANMVAEDSGYDYDDDYDEYMDVYNRAYDDEVQRIKDNGRVVNAYLKIKNPFVVSNDVRISVEEAYEIAKNGPKLWVRDWVYEISRNATDGSITTDQLVNNNYGGYVSDALRKMGKYDGIIDKTVHDKFNAPSGTQHIIAFDSAQIKSADPVTYDDSGNVIPLSERFNKKNPDIRYSDRDTESVSNRSMLANAMESLAKTELEKKKLLEYKEKIDQINAEEQKLSEVRANIKELSFAKGPRDKEKLRALRDEAIKLSHHIGIYDKQLLRLEASKPLQNVLDREKAKAYQRGKEKGEAALKEYKQKAMTEQEQMKKRYEESRKRSVENRNKTAMRHKIRKTIRELDKLLNRGSKERNVKEGMKDFVEQALASAELLFADDYSTEDMVRNGVGVMVDANENRLLEETQRLLQQRTDLYSLGFIGSEMDEVITGDTSSYENRMKESAKLDREIAKNMTLLRGVFERERARINKASVSSVLDDLARAYKKLGSSNNLYIRNVTDENVYQHLLSMSERMNGAIVKDMNLSQLEDVYKAYTMVLHSIRNANKLFVKGKTESVEKMTEAIAKEFGSRKIPEKKLAIIARNLSNKMGWDYEKLYYALDRIGSQAFSDLVMNIANSENIVMQDVMEAHAFEMEMVERYGYNNWAVNKEIDKEFLDNTGKKFKLTLGQMMALYAYSRREGAWDHIEYGGFVFGKAALTNPKPADSYKLTEDQCKAITNLLTNEQKGYVESMQKFLSETMGKKGNEVSMLMYGIEMFGEKNYFPIHVAGQFKAQANESEAKAAAGFSSMSNAGFTHAQNPNAKAPFVLEGFNEVWVDHVNEMSRYHGAVPALEDMRRVMNHSSYSESTKESMSIKQMMENSYGKDAVDYFNNLYKEANSGAIADKLQKRSKKLISLFRKNSVAYSLSVLIQQPTSITRAYAMIDPRYFGYKGVGAITSGVVKTAVNKWTNAQTKAYTEMLKYAPGVTMAKEIGGFDTATGGSIRSYLLDTNKSLKQKWKTGTALEKGKAVMDLVDDNSVANLPNLADKIAWIEIWNACKREALAKHTNLRPSNDALLQIVGKRFTEVVRATQVYDSIFAKSPLLKSDKIGVQMLVSFMNEPNTVANMAESALRDFARDDKKNGFRKAAVLVNGIIVTGVLKSIVYAMRDDDEDETYIEKYIEALTSSLINDFNPLNYIPLARDAWSLAQGYDVERSDMAIVADAVDSLHGVIKNVHTETDDMTEEELVEFDKKCTEAGWKLAESMSAFFGIPMKNIRREIMAILDHARIASKNKGLTTKKSLSDKVYDAVIDSIPFTQNKNSKNDKLYDAIISGDTKYLNRLKSGYKTDKSYRSAVRKALRESDYRIKEAAELRFSGNFDAYKKLFLEIKDEGYFTFDDIMSAVNSEVSNLEKKSNGNVEEETKETSENSALFKYEHYYTAVAGDNKTAAKTIYDDLVAEKIADGYLKHEAEDAIATGLVEQIGKAYRNGEITKTKAVQLLENHTEKDESEVKKWDFELEYGFPWSNRVRKYRLGKISESKLISAVMDIEGATMEEAKEYIQFLNLEMANGDVDITANDAAGYFEYAKTAGIPIDLYLDFKEFDNSTENDIDEVTGKEKSYSAVKKIMAYINSLNLTDRQKDALAKSAGWSEKTIQKYKLW